MSSYCNGQYLTGTASGSCVFGNCLMTVIAFKTLTSGTATISGSSTCNATFVVEVNGNNVADFLQGQYVTLNLQAGSDVTVYARLPATISSCTANAYVCYTGQVTNTLPPPNNTFGEAVIILIIVTIILAIVAAIIFFLKAPF